MSDSYIRATTLQSTLNVHQAPSITSNDGVSTGLHDRVELPVEHGARNLSHLHSECATKSTTVFSAGETHTPRIGNAVE
jgi:hypothetical protein